MTERETITLREHFEARFDSIDERVERVEAHIHDWRQEHRDALTQMRAENADDHLQTATQLGAVHAELRAIRDAYVRAEGADSERKRQRDARASVRREILATLGGLGVATGIVAFVIDHF